MLDLLFDWLFELLPRWVQIAIVIAFVGLIALVLAWIYWPQPH